MAESQQITWTRLIRRGLENSHQSTTELSYSLSRSDISLSLKKNNKNSSGQKSKKEQNILTKNLQGFKKKINKKIEDWSPD